MPEDYLLPSNYERNRLLPYYEDYCYAHDLDPADDHWDAFYAFLNERGDW